jgi:hypothetical protein
MANSKISQLLSATTLTGTELVPVVQGGVTKKTTVLALNKINGYVQPFTLISTGIPFVLPSSGTMGNNGALTVTTAVPRQYPSAYVYLPANAISAGSAAGWYYAVFSSTAAATLYNNTYTSGTPVIPASPTAFVTTGSGAYVQTIASNITGLSIPIPAGTLGVTGSLAMEIHQTNNNSATAKTISLGTAAGFGIGTATGQTTAAYTFTLSSLYCEGVQTLQYISNLNSGSSIQPTAPAYRTGVDFSAAQTLITRSQIAAVTDTVVLEAFKIIASS